MDRVYVSKMQKRDIPFLCDLWRNPATMKYADEFPYLRGWSRADDLETAWEKYKENRHNLGDTYMQLIVRLRDSTPIGESFFAQPLGKTFIGRWKIPENTVCLIGDIKLLPDYWGQGLGTEGMRGVVKYVFTRTSCNIFVVPPHKDNTRARRVYEKAGFVLIIGKKSGKMLWAGHMLMELTRERFREMYSRNARECMNVPG